MQQVDAVPGRDPHGDERVVAEHRRWRGRDQPTVDTSLHVVGQRLGPAGVQHDLAGSGAERPHVDPEALHQLDGRRDGLAGPGVVREQQHLGKFEALGQVAAGALDQRADQLEVEAAAAGVERQAGVAVRGSGHDIRRKRWQPLERPPPVGRERDDGARLGLEPAHRGESYVPGPLPEADIADCATAVLPVGALGHLVGGVALDGVDRAVGVDGSRRPRCARPRRSGRPGCGLDARPFGIALPVFCAQAYTSSTRPKPWPVSPSGTPASRAAHEVK